MFNARPLTTVVPILIACALFSSCAPEARPAAQASEATTASAVPALAAGVTVQTIRIPVEGMSCVACAANVKKTLVAIAGVEEVEVHLGERNARVRFDSRQITPDRLVAAINGLGYSAGTPVTAER